MGNGRNNQTGMPNNLRQGMERLSGQNMADVRVHTNSAQPAQVQAHAYARGNSAQLSPDQARHLPHEMSHVQQQRVGAVRPAVGAPKLQNVGRNK